MLATYPPQLAIRYDMSDALNTAQTDDFQNIHSYVIVIVMLCYYVTLRLTVSHAPPPPPPPPHHNFAVIAPMIMKFGTGVKLDEFYAMVTKKFVTSLLLGTLRNDNGDSNENARGFL